MKKALLIFFAAAGVISCQKQDSKPMSANLFGRWELAATHGGLSMPRPAPTGNGDMYQFNKDSTYSRYIDNKITAQGKFSINITETRDSLKFGIITFTNPTYKDAWMQSVSGRIIIGSSAADGPSYEYRKISSK
ncbi:hypothetical protein FPZ43_04455 [Mucilaginibacter pallidiroseus]|uniref:Lipocalin-like domain-containing protein n=1 Tax=Mucilaginibacter pallidiroseus TaxID=2599295 RepID=A0A563UFS2_9SPHI|nr:hypothetical protein [Mucilaginibacter pallidiroseus]TWR30201.1 hypothetical protein FPZ43_04455 [Mucilaginibacter pallidiroseus]